MLIQDRGTCRELSDVLNSAVVQEFPESRRGAGGPWVGMGERLPAYAAATSWEQALRALRFASSTWHGRRVVAYERLGSLALLGELPGFGFRREPQQYPRIRPRPIGRRRSPVDAEGRIAGEDSYHSGPVEIRKLRFDELPGEYVELVHSKA